jgi:hypothetical protein
MPPPCSRCDSQRVINLETARKLGIAAGALAGTLKGAYTSLYAPGRLIAYHRVPGRPGSGRRDGRYLRRYRRCRRRPADGAAPVSTR